MLDNYGKPICPRHRAISLLLANDPQLLDFIFNKDRTRLSGSPSNILYEMGCFSSGQQVLVRIALDIWSGEGESRLDDIIWTLDQDRFESFLLAIESLRFSKLLESPRKGAELAPSMPINGGGGDFR